MIAAAMLAVGVPTATYATSSDNPTAQSEPSAKQFNKQQRLDAFGEGVQQPDSERRLRELEHRVQELETVRAETATPDPAARRRTSSAFNPAVSLILDGKLSSFSKDPATYALPGFALAEETGPGEEGLTLGESELVLSANVDDKFYGSFTAALTPENEVEVEEAFIETLALGSGAIIKAGRFLSHIGYLNPVHAHAWDFVDQPLVYQAMLGNQYGDDGVQVRWVAPTDLFVEIGAELFRGNAFPAGGAADSGKGVNSLFVHVGGDLGVSHAWRLGLSRLDADAQGRATQDAVVPDFFNGNSKLTGVDFIWKWAPNGNSSGKNFKFQLEYFKRDEDGAFDPGSSGSPVAYTGEQRGWYAQAVYQFLPRWRVGLRLNRLESDAIDTALTGTALDHQGHKPTRNSLMVDWSNSEYSRLRLQFNRDESRADGKDNQWILQYVMSLGAHGAHSF